MSPLRILAALVLASGAGSCRLAADEIPVGVSVERTFNIRTGSIGAIVRLTPAGPSGRRIEAGRVTILQATDDTGEQLTEEGSRKFYSVSVGRIDDSMDFTCREPTTLALFGLAKNATSLKTVEGTLEVVIPDRDPHSVVIVDAIASRLGIPIPSPDLDKAHVTVVVYDKKTAESMAQEKSPGGPQAYDGGPTFGPPPPGLPSWAATGARPSEMDENDLAVAISDPESRLVHAEFQTREGLPIRYDHRGRYHSSEPVGHREIRFDVYHLGDGIPEGCRLVCYLITEKSRVSVNIRLADVALPQPTTRRSDAGTLFVVMGESRSTAAANIEYEKNSGGLRQHEAPKGLERKILQLWSDIPAYAAILKGDSHYDSLPKLVTSVPPKFPDVPPLYLNVAVSVLVSFVVGEKGTVEAARVADSNDPRFNQAALDAVLQWNFRPAMMAGQPARAFVVVPVRFDFSMMGAGPARAASPPYAAPSHS